MHFHCRADDFIALFFVDDTIQQNFPLLIYHSPFVLIRVIGGLIALFANNNRVIIVLCPSNLTEPVRLTSFDSVGDLEQAPWENIPTGRIEQKRAPSANPPKKRRTSSANSNELETISSYALHQPKHHIFQIRGYSRNWRTGSE
jgi:hypothetical protein